MIIRFYIDPDTSEPHIFEHGVSADEVREVLRKPLEEAKSRKHSIIALGQTRAGRYLKIIYSRDEDNDGIFVITAFDLPPKQIAALGRRMRGRPK